jgi:hypothetical protein
MGAMVVLYVMSNVGVLFLVEGADPTWRLTHDRKISAMLSCVIYVSQVLHSSA